MRKGSSLSPFFFKFFFFVFLLFLFFGLGGGSWVGLDTFTLGWWNPPGLILGNTGIQWDGGIKPA